jgi:hypothetical protein
MVLIHKISDRPGTIFAWTVCGRLAMRDTSDRSWYTVTCPSCLKEAKNG